MTRTGALLLLGSILGFTPVPGQASESTAAPGTPLPAAATSSPVAAASQEAVETILLYGGRAPARAHLDHLSDLSELDLDGLVAAWVWTSRLPPRRLAPEGLADELARLRDGEAANDVRSLRIRLPDLVEAPEIDLGVVAGPPALFEEVPEAWIPHWPLSSAGTAEIPRWSGTPWRVRLVGDGRGSAWLDVASRDPHVVLVPVPASPLRVTVKDSAGHVVPQAQVTVTEDVQGTPRPAVWSRLLASDQGQVRSAAFPDEVIATFVVSAAGSASRVLRGRAADLPAEVFLPAGARLRGHFVDEDGEPSSAVKVRAEGWLANDVPFTFTRAAESAADGSWELTALPPGRLVLQASRKGYVPLRQTLDLEEGRSRDLGELLLVRGAELPVRVHDEQGEGIAGVSVRAAHGVGRAISDADGRAVLADLVPGVNLELRVEAEGFLPRQIELPAPWPEEASLALTRPLTVTGRFTEADGRPVVGGTVRVEHGESFRFEEMVDGELDLELEPGVAYTLRLSSPATARITVELEPGVPGERRDLGQITAPPGLVVTGTVLSALDGLPVSGARVWLPRPSPDPIGAWFLGDLLETWSDEFGRFVLGGLQPKPELLRIDATGFARRHVEVQPEVDVPEVDLGQIDLAAGVAVRVQVPEAEDEDFGGTIVGGATVRLDLRGQWSDLDMLTATVADGLAELPHVPPGPALLTVMAGRELVCEEPLEVGVDEDPLEVVCERERRPVSGVVLAAGQVAGAGTLVWATAEQTAVKATILDRESSLGLRQQQVVGRGRPPVLVEVADDGTFSTDKLASGFWNVTWWPAGGSPASPRRIEVPDGPAPQLVVRLPGGAVAGRVLDELGAAVDGAWVRELNGRGLARSGANGDFSLTGLETGTARLQAQRGELFSGVVEVRLAEDVVPDPVDLVLAADHGGRLAVQLWSEAGLAASGAFVFFDLGERGIQVVSTDGAGRAELTTPAPYPPRARFAAVHEGRWIFGEWLDWERFRRGVEAQVRASGELQVECEEQQAAPSLGAPHGWDLSLLLSLLGSRPTLSPDRPLLLSGLPEGTYHVSDDRSVNVRSGRRERIELD